MTETTRADVPLSARAAPRCPRCGGSLSEPISGDVHCFVECRECAERFELDDPRLAG